MWLVPFVSDSKDELVLIKLISNSCTDWKCYLHHDRFQRLHNDTPTPQRTWAPSPDSIHEHGTPSDWIRGQIPSVGAFLFSRLCCPLEAADSSSASSSNLTWSPVQTEQQTHTWGTYWRWCHAVCLLSLTFEDWKVKFSCRVMPLYWFAASELQSNLRVHTCVMLIVSTSKLCFLLQRHLTACSRDVSFI